MAGWVLAAFPLRAAVILSDDFSYPDGPITNAPGAPWVAHNGSGSNEEVLVVSGNVQLTSSRTEDVHAPLASQPYTTNAGAVLYAGFTVNFTGLPTAGGTYFAHFNASSSHRCVVWASTANATNGTFRLGIGNTSGATSASGRIATNLSLNTPYTVVTRYSTATGQSALWLNPTAETDDSVTATDAPNLASISNFSFRQNTGMGTLLVDDLRVGTSFADAIGAINPIPPSVPAGALSILTYNVKGNGAADWSTNAPQVQAIGRELMYLNPDIITFNEIPYAYTYEMTNWVIAYLPGYYLATNSGTDGYIRSVIASRFPITRSKSWLPHADLNPFGYTNSNFTRDLFEAEISVPNFAQPLHVFTTHLKATDPSFPPDDAGKRAAEAAAITNFFATNFFVLYPTHPYLLTGDLNESDTNALSIQRLLSVPAGLHLTNPTNPFTGSSNTYSIQASLSKRLDYILPGDLLFTNIYASQVFRTDVLNPIPTNLMQFDNQAASDHLPVLMVFNNPYETPFLLTLLAMTNQLYTLQWRATPGQQFFVESSADLSHWVVRASNITSTAITYTTTLSVTGNPGFFRVSK